MTIPTAIRRPVIASLKVEGVFMLVPHIKLIVP
jgi:hypothetical protein